MRNHGYGQPDDGRSLGSGGPHCGELIERSELNEIVLGPIDWDDLRTASSKLTVAIGNSEA